MTDDVTDRFLTDDQQLIIYQENAETFRSLNQLMWQVPLIAMTLTGGLWFGVSRSDTLPGLQLSLLGMAALGNFVLIFVLARLRYIMGEYLNWMQRFYPKGAVLAKGGKFWERPATVRTMFQIMLGVATIVSALLMTTTAFQAKWLGGDPSHARAVTFYDQNATALADSYEGLSFEAAHPELAAALSASPPLRILDVGSGSGRDAAAMAALNHHVTALEPSDRMRALAQQIHPTAKVVWTKDALPRLESISAERFDVILLSAVWMHVEPSQRRAAFDRLSQLLAPGGRIYMTLRIGPAAPERAIYRVSEPELDSLARGQAMTVIRLNQRADLLGRPNVTWTSVMIHPSN